MQKIGPITVVEAPEDMPPLLGWLQHQDVVAIDTETTGLDIYSAGHKLRLVQFGNTREAWVIQAENLPKGYTADVFRKILGRRQRLVMHNASYDIQVLTRHLGVPSEKLWWLTRDTKILSHLIDPRGREDGGTGHRLEDLTERYLPNRRKLTTSLRDEFLRLKAAGEIPRSTPLARLFEVMPIDNEVYLCYAGNDAMITAQLWQKLATPATLRQYGDLLVFEHKLAKIAMLMDQRGFLLDEKYTSALSAQLAEQEAFHKAEAASLGCLNINSPPQVISALQARGIQSDRKTPKGNPTVDKVLLKAHSGDELVRHIIEGKRAGKWRKTWIENFLTGMDQAGRVHPSTSTLRARTARFSITGIPAQTLPSGDSLVRSCFVADTGHRIVGVDYSNQELRFAAAMAPDARMIKAFRAGEDLHYITAETAWPGQGHEMRKYGKGGNFATLYGGGSRALMDQFGMTLEQADSVRLAIKQAYPGIKVLSDRLINEAKLKGYITTWTGRQLPVDKTKIYAALNYYIQSGCRDITAQGMVRLYDAGFTEYMRLAIHDEIVFSLPDQQLRMSQTGPGIVDEIESIMSTRMRAVDMPAQAKIGGRSWGSLYEKEAA